MQTLKAGALYFIIVFGAGFLLAIPRTLWVIPQLGARTAELLEFPLMLLVIIFAARWIVRRFSLPPTIAARLGTGLVALALLLATEFTVVLKLRRLTLAQYIAGRDPLAGAAYVLMLLVFAFMPLILSKQVFRRVARGVTVAALSLGSSSKQRSFLSVGAENALEKIPQQLEKHLDTRA